MVVREFAFADAQTAGVQRVWPCLLAGLELMFDHSTGIFQCAGDGGDIPVLPQTSHFCIFALNLVYNLSYCLKAKVKKIIESTAT